ncbi:MAG TPA: hypothetical protein VIQ00_06530 [Chitinophagaceae bacterium]|jgi:DNA polymerase III, gamma/tau subunits
MQFSDIIGQQQPKQKLVELIQNNRLSHALLFLAREGSGGLPMALAFSQYIVCEKTNIKPTASSESFLFGGEAPSPRFLSDACGLCPSCVKARQFIHPDIHFSFPVIPKKTGTAPVSSDYITDWREFIAQHPYGNVYDWLQFIGAENKQGNITAQECNDIIRKLNLKSFESGYKILIMWMPEYLGNEGNKLLKLIEEPPANTLFILVGESDSRILPTILSRCQLIKLPALENADVEQALINRNKTAPGQAALIAGVAEGNYREALLLSLQATEDWQSLLRDWLNAILKSGPVAQTKWVEEVSRLGREKQKQFLRYFNHLLEQAVRLQAIGEENMQLPADEKDFATRLNKITDISQQQAIIEELDKASYYIERNANGKILFHALTIKLHRIIRDKIVFA